ncbi:hypothetical protein FSP39_004953 [Pinctada imbricata]|uniref:Reverse transcriptase domain-containing protein n=1 Tax=Pinctada imbricata TaxID=66713 RepID=A0AA88YHN6_PINIB|nr:hypothetical protein FSP39_004953 [Pinctada imbricata]
MSKIFEKALSSQLSEFFEPIFNKFLCVFRKGYGCQTTLLRLIEDWKMALDQNMYVAAILMDLSKAFDCLPHNVLLRKLEAYGLSGDSLQLIHSYLSNRRQQVKIGNSLSRWADIHKGVPQGSILGPLLFNVFINDIFYFIDKSTLYNYADDNTLSFASPNFKQLINVLETESNILIDWFTFNCMKANPEKFQAIAIGKKTFNKETVFNLKGDINITCEDTVKLLGIEIDYQLKFDAHISNLCRKASQQLAVLKRIGNHLCHLSKLTIFHTFIMSHFNFCPLAWHFCSLSNTKKLEKVQERALRFIYSDFTSSYECLLDKAQVSSLHVKRLRTMALETYKIVNKLCPPVLYDLVQMKDSKYNFRYSNILQVDSVRTSSYGKQSFKYAASVLWNSLPNDFRESNSFNHFKTQIRFLSRALSSHGMVTHVSVTSAVISNICDNACDM